MIDGIAERVVPRPEFVKGERKRLLTAACMIRVILLVTLMPGADVQGRGGVQDIMARAPRNRRRSRKSKSPRTFVHVTAKDAATRIAPAVITMANNSA